tara:strand:- start:697 stop:930 length:234 start_codon:yes stop_codon:yes gene_type:complete
MDENDTPALSVLALSEKLGFDPAYVHSAEVAIGPTGAELVVRMAIPFGKLHELVHDSIVKGKEELREGTEANAPGAT